MKIAALVAAALLLIVATPAAARAVRAPVECNIFDFERTCAQPRAEPRRLKSPRKAAQRVRKHRRHVGRAHRKERLTVERASVSARFSRRVVAAFPETSGFASVSRPARYVAGRLICAINVNLALAERGIKGTGSAVAKSFLGWGRSSGPVPGAVAVSSRRGGGHVAIVSRVVNGQVMVWNPSTRGRGWREVVYRHRAISYRVPG